jgi:ubiquinone/menaquinone biosynthesis C-methylase UbiE
VLSRVTRTRAGPAGEARPQFARGRAPADPSDMRHPFCCALFVVLVGQALSIASAQTVPDAHEAHRLHENPAEYIAALDDPARDEYQKPHEVLQALDIKAGEIVADIGAGSGYFTLRLAHHVGQSGRVYAVDVSPDMIRHLHTKVRDARLLNVSPILAPPDDPFLPQAVDRFVIVDVWHHVEDQPAYLSRMRKLLKPGGQIVMIDFHKRDLPVGPPASMKIAREDLLRQMTDNGFRLVKEHTFLPYQYFLVFEAAG